MPDLMTSVTVRLSVDREILELIRDLARAKHAGELAVVGDRADALLARLDAAAPAEHAEPAEPAAPAEPGEPAEPAESTESK